MERGGGSGQGRGQRGGRGQQGGDGSDTRPPPPASVVTVVRAVAQWSGEERRDWDLGWVEQRVGGGDTRTAGLRTPVVKGEAEEASWRRLWEDGRFFKHGRDSSTCKRPWGEPRTGGGSVRGVGEGPPGWGR